MTPPGTVLEIYRWSGERLAGPQNSPGTLEVHRPEWGYPYLVRASKDGYCPQYWVTPSRASAGAWSYLWMIFIPAAGPILLAATISLIDASTGGCCAMDPDVFKGSLQEETACVQ
jgi:hypothetical protein